VPLGRPDTARYLFCRTRDGAMRRVVIPWLDFSASAELMERAAAEAKKWIEQGGLERRARPQELSPHRH
jgi:hypothetical protein